MATLSLATNPEARSVIDRSSVKKSTLLGATLFVTATLLYVLTFSVLLLSHAWWWKACCAPVLGFSISVLFVIAHDACHGSLTPIQWLNKLVGRIGFLASFHPYAAWEWTHNAKHHGFTNVRGEDIVYVPFSPDEFARLPLWRRYAERLFALRLAWARFTSSPCFYPTRSFHPGSASRAGRRRRNINGIAFWSSRS
jgi:omega-6 fatty acid desaturase (delta-12 desaturase)